MTAPRYRYLATNDEASDCNCCGRRGLKRVVWLAELGPEGDAIGDGESYGTTCAAHLLLRRHPQESKPKLSEAQKVLAAAEKAVRSAAYNEAMKLEAPAAEIFINTHNVRCARRGDVQVAGMRNDDFDQHAVARRDERAKEESLFAWYQHRAVEIAARWGHACRPYEIAQAGL